MNFSAKEQNILKIIAVVLILTSYFFFYLKGQLKEVSKIKSQIVTLENESKNNEALKVVIDSMDKDITNLKSVMEGIRIVYPGNYNHEDIIMMLKNLEETTNIRISTFNIGDPSALGDTTVKNAKAVAVPVAETKPVQITDPRLLELNKALGIQMQGDPNAIAQAEKSMIADGKAFVEQLTISAKGSYSGLKKFLLAIEGLKSRSVVKRMDLSRNVDETLNISIALDMYGIKEQVKRQPHPLETQESVPSDVFKPYTGFVNDQKAVITPIPNASGSDSLVYAADFTARVLPFGNGMSPQILTLTAKKAFNGKELTSTSVGADKDGVEESDIYIEEINGKYYFKMKTSTEAYPDKQYVKTAEFSPMGDALSFFIDSTIRKSANDKSGVKFTVTNKTKKTLNITIVNDDKTRPRVSVIKNTPNIFVKN